MKKIIIKIENEDEIETALLEVLRLTKEGFLSGISPDWGIIESNEK